MVAKDIESRAVKRAAGESREKDINGNILGNSGMKSLCWIEENEMRQNQTLTVRWLLPLAISSSSYSFTIPTAPQHNHITSQSSQLLESKTPSLISSTLCSTPFTKRNRCTAFRMAEGDDDDSISFDDAAQSIRDEEDEERMGERNEMADEVRFNHYWWGFTEASLFLTYTHTFTYTTQSPISSCKTTQRLQERRGINAKFSIYDDMRAKIRARTADLDIEKSVTTAEAIKAATDRALSGDAAAASSPFTSDLSKITDGATAFSKTPNSLMGTMVATYSNGVGTRENISWLVK